MQSNTQSYVRDKSNIDKLGFIHVQAAAFWYKCMYYDQNSII